MWDNTLNLDWTSEERDLLDRAVEFTNITAGHTDLFEIASLFLGKISEAEHILIGHLNSSEQWQIKPISYVYRGSTDPELAGKFKDVSCVQVFGEKIFYEPFKVQTLFPVDPVLADLGIRNYIGATLNDENNGPIGILVLMDRKPFVKVAFLEALLGIFSLPLEKEIRKLLVVQADI